MAQPRDAALINAENSHGMILFHYAQYCDTIHTDIQGGHKNFKTTQMYAK